MPSTDGPEKTTFRDPVTGRSLHCFTEQGSNASPYFNSHAWTPDSEWFFFLRVADHGESLMACEYATGALRRLAGPFPLEPRDDRIIWATLNAIPGTRAATYIRNQALWRADLDGDGRAERIASLPGRSGADTDVSSDGRWHVLALYHASDKAWQELEQAGWPCDPVMARHEFSSELIRVDLSTGRLETLWTEKQALVDHISVNPKDPDLILFCHEGAGPYQYGRMFLRRVGEATNRPLRDQRSGRVWVTHERWFPDGERISYHGEYRGLPLFGDAASHAKRHYYVGILDVARDLPREYLMSDPARQPWHCPPSPDGWPIVTDSRGGQGGIDLLLPDDATGVCRIEPLCSLSSDAAPLPVTEQWRERDPIWSPDGRKILFRTARQGTVQVYVVDVEE